MSEYAVKLKKSFEYGGETYTELKVREPKVSEIQKFGLPFTFDDKGKIKFDLASSFQYACAMNQIPAPILEKQLDENKDATKLVQFSMLLLNFFDLAGE